jgi:hypothetical protein
MRAPVLAVLTVTGGGLLLAGCGTPPVATTPSPLGSSVSITADPAECTTSDTGKVCTVRVWYANTSRSDVDIDPTNTELVDGNGEASLPVVYGNLPSGTRVAPGDKFAVTWSLALPADSTVSAVLWRGGDGQIQSLPLGLADTGSSPSPSPSATAVKPKPKPKPVVKPKPKPVTTQPRPTVSKQPSSGSTKPPASGTIG